MSLNKEIYQSKVNKDTVRIRYNCMLSVCQIMKKKTVIKR